MNNPTPKKTKNKVDTFEDTMFLMDLYKHKMQLAKYEKKVLVNLNLKTTHRPFFKEKMIQEMAMEQKRKNERAKGKVANYIR